MIDYMYHPGDRVRVRPDLSEGEGYKMVILDWMKKYAGQEIVIEKIKSASGVYKAQGIDGCIWSDEMFEPFVVDECVCDSLL